MVRVGIPGAEATAEVVYLVMAQGGHRRHRRRERLGVEDLGTDVDVQPAHPQSRTVLDPLDQIGGGRGREAELRSGMAGEHARVRVRGDTWDDAYEDVLPTPGWHGRLEPIDVVAVVDDDQTDSVFHS